MVHRSGFIGILLMLMTILFAPTVMATKPTEHQVTICHRDDDNLKPYVQETVDIASSGFLKAGHNDHTGPVWNPTLKDQHIKWGDIIPPYSYGDFTFAGLNWTEEGRRFYDNGCAQPSEQPTPTPTSTNTASVPPSVDPTPTATPTTVPSVVPSGTPTSTSTPVASKPSTTPPPTDTLSDTQPDRGSLFPILLLLGSGLTGLGLTFYRVHRRS